MPAGPARSLLREANCQSAVEVKSYAPSGAGLILQGLILATRTHQLLIRRRIDNA